MEELAEIIKGLEKRIELLEKTRVINTLIFTDEGTLVVPVVTDDPADPTNGQIWYNSTSNELKIEKNGTVRTITTS